MDERDGSGMVGFLGTWTQGLKGPWRNARGQNRDPLAGRVGVSWKTKAGLGIDVSGRNGLEIWLFLKRWMTHSFKENFLRSDIHLAWRKQMN